ncbi:Lrp/AsnC family transcriptional regulator [Mucisphaera sp.]|uniref:Lrp/AsnC family transcriptional regulator n=1 Tax=Mucisphaera sp. TaxID=2913024 RepID=UPI003D12AEB8
MSTQTLPIQVDDPVNARILAVSEDQIQGFVKDPFAAIARATDLDEATVCERIRAMLEAGVIRRVRQTVLATSLAPGALVAWHVDTDQLDTAFDWMSKQDPFSGHVVIRSTDADSPGSAYRLWTTVKVPQGYSLQAHCDFIKAKVNAHAYRAMPANRLFTLGVGHVRRKGMEPGSRSDAPGAVQDTNIVHLTDLEWQVLPVLKDEFKPEEIRPQPWDARAQAAGLTLDDFFAGAESLQTKGVIGRFSTFLEHHKQVAGQKRVASFNALFHWRVPEGKEIDAGKEVGRHHIMTHAYWREGGPEFNNVNIMGVAHGQEKARVLEHKAAIDNHLAEAGIDVSYTNVFWGGRSEIKPSEILPQRYRRWCANMGIDPQTHRA